MVSKLIAALVPAFSLSFADLIARRTSRGRLVDVSTIETIHAFLKFVDIHCFSPLPFAPYIAYIYYENYNY